MTTESLVRVRVQGTTGELDYKMSLIEDERLATDFENNLQRGVYRVGGAKLYLNLANVLALEFPPSLADSSPIR